MSNDKPGFIIVGPQKCATSWVFECLKDHPEVYMPETDAVDYFNINLHKDEDWYLQHFEDADESDIVGEESPTYIRDERVPKRLYDYFGEDIKIIMILRNPVDRAFSQYWHEKGREKIDREFEEMLDVYDLYSDWVLPGFYYYHLTRFMGYFERDQIKIMIFDDLVESDKDFIQEIYEFIGANPDYEPSKLNQKVNEAAYSWLKFYEGPKNFFRDNAPEFTVKTLRPVHSSVKNLVVDKDEYEKGMDDEIRAELEEIYRKDVENLSDLLDRDLTHWVEKSE